MKDDLPIFRYMVGLALGAIFAVLCMSLGAILSTPSPSLPQMRVAEAVAALRGAEVPGLDRRIIDAPPDGRASHLVAQAAATSLGVAAQRVRASWLEAARSVDAVTPLQTVTFVAGQEAIVEADADGFKLWSGSAAKLAPDVPVPPFTLALAIDDGRWLTVTPKEPLLSPWRLRLILTLLIAGVFLVPLIWFSARRLTRPVRQLAEAADRLRLAPEQEPIRVTGPKEVRAAAEALNGLRERLLGEVQERTRMLAAVAHDLRNPLTSLRMRAELAAMPHRTRMVADIDRMSAMVTQVLEYARGREIKEGFQVVDLAALVSQWIAGLHASDEEVACGKLQRGLNVRVQVETLRRAYDNLLENALRYAGEARISVTQCAGGATLAIEDRGPGIAPDQIERLLRPFERLDPSRSSDTGGVGLGLAIAKAIAREHGGHLKLTSRPGGGVNASLWLPLNAEAEV